MGQRGAKRRAVQLAKDALQVAPRGRDPAGDVVELERLAVLGAQDRERFAEQLGATLICRRTRSHGAV
jgi:hypothetical protein